MMFDCHPSGFYQHSAQVTPTFFGDASSAIGFPGLVNTGP
jgi:hypothetical protein